MEFTRRRYWPKTRPTFIAVAVSALLSNGASAIEFRTAAGWNGSINTTVAYASSWRAEERDKALVNGMNAVEIGWQPRYTDNLGNPFPVSPPVPPGVWFNPAPFPAGTVKTVYEAARAGWTGESKGASGNMNYGKNDRYSESLKFISELSVAKDGTGALVRVKGWYDTELNKGSVPWGNQANGFAFDKPLSDEGAPRLNRFDGLELLDAYAYTSFDIGDNPAQIRVGRQALNWGESLFIQGVNQISPVDVAALRRAGTEIKEALLPVWSVNGSIGLPGGTSLEGFYQAKWEASSIDGCGTYWAGGINISADAGACTMIAAIGAWNSDASAYRGPSPVPGYPATLYAPFIDGRKGSDSGQYGMAFRFPVESLDTEFGLYAMQINARVPVLSYYNSKTPGGINPATGLPVMPGLLANRTSRGFLEYADDIRIYGLSAATTLYGVSWGAELSLQKNVPVQISTPDLTVAVGAYGLLGNAARGPDGVWGQGPMGERVKAAGPDGYVQGYERHEKWQLQLNGVAVLPSMLGATNGTVIGEVAFQWNDLPDYRKMGNIRFGRAAEFGFGAVPYGFVSRTYGTLTGAAAAGLQCTETVFGPGFNPAGCKNDGYMTDFAWGYRLRGQLDYPNVFDLDITASPIVFFAHDVKGVSMDNQLNGGRQTLALTLRLNKNKAHNLDLNYTTYRNSATYDALRDRDNYSIAYSYTF